MISGDHLPSQTGFLACSPPRMEWADTKSTTRRDSIVSSGWRPLSGITRLKSDCRVPFQWSGFELLSSSEMPTKSPESSERSQQSLSRTGNWLAQALTGALRCQPRADPCRSSLQVSHLHQILRAGIADLGEDFEGGSCCRKAFPSAARFRVLEGEPEWVPLPAASGRYWKLLGRTTYLGQKPQAQSLCVCPWWAPFSWWARWLGAGPTVYLWRERKCWRLGSGGSGVFSRSLSAPVAVLLAKMQGVFVYRHASW